jgi:hypothetical protein
MNPTLSATIDKNVFNILEAILPWFVYSNDSVSTYVDSLPIFRWDPDSETFILGLRKDEEPEKIWLVGKPSDEQLLANSNVINDKPSLHGVAIGDASWTEETDINNLHSEVVLVYRKWDGLIGVERSNPSFTSRAVSQASYEQLNNLIQESPNSEFSQLNLGYVGFNKILYKNFIENGNFKTSKLMRLQLFRDEYSSRFTIQNLTLNVYVTQPLKSHYKFTVDSFEDSGVIDYSGEYIFNTVTYEINADTNLIKAKIEGEYIPVPD